MDARVRTGLDSVRVNGLALPGAGRFGLLCNNAVTDRELTPALELLLSLSHLRCERIFSPQHGFAGEKQDNMVESRDGSHPSSGIPILSLYGRVREPEPEMLAGLDAIVIDLPDVGTRVYTFMATALLVMRAASRAGVPVWVLDRPNPINGIDREGPILAPGFTSFVGLAPVPLRHGLTAGEYCLFGREALGLDVELHVVPVEGWTRAQWFDGTGLPWVLPSPNLPTLDSATVYPGGVLLEGVNLSEGRGTTRPFELWGAPWLDPTLVGRAFARQAHAMGLEGLALRAVAYEPTFHKFVGETVRGFQVHVTDRARFRSVAAWIALFHAVRSVHGGEFAWRQPPYEYEHDRLPIDLLFGTDRIRLAFEAGAEAVEIARAAEAGMDAFEDAARPHLLYR